MTSEKSRWPACTQVSGPASSSTSMVEGSSALTANQLWIGRSLQQHCTGSQVPLPGSHSLISSAVKKVAQMGRHGFAHSVSLGLSTCKVKRTQQPPPCTHVWPRGEPHCTTIAVPMPKAGVLWSTSHISLSCFNPLVCNNAKKKTSQYHPKPASLYLDCGIKYDFCLIYANIQTHVKAYPYWHKKNQNM